MARGRGPGVPKDGFEKIGYAGVDLPMPVPPEYEHFKATVGSLVDHGTLRFRGASVTAPHKENLIRFVEERGGRVDETAGRLHAANTLVVGNAASVACTTTDAPVIPAAH